MSLSDGDASPIRKGSLATPTRFGCTGQVTDNRDGIIVDDEIQAGMPPDAPRLAPAISRATTATSTVPEAVTADRGYGEAAVDAALTEPGVGLVAILRKGGSVSPDKPSRPNQISLKWSIGAPEPKAASPR